MIIADKITDLRKRNGWSQEELAEKLGVICKERKILNKGLVEMKDGKRYMRR